MKTLRSFLAVLVCITACIIIYNPAWARQITDMAGRTVNIPDNPQKIYAPDIVGEYFLITIAPDMLCGLTRPIDVFHPNAGLMMPEGINKLPIIGSLTGDSTMGGNPEMLLVVKPDLVVLFNANTPQDQSPTGDRGTALLDKLGIPYIYVSAKTLRDYPAAYAFMGEVLNRRERAQKLGDYIDAVVAENDRIVAAVPPEKRPKVYYACGVDGLNTTGTDSFRTTLLLLAGNLNVHKHTMMSAEVGGGYDKVSAETVMGYEPDIIFVFDKPFYDTVYDSPAWKQVKAVQNKQVYMVPWAPFNWFDRPPASFMGAIGLQLILSKAYPEHYTKDIVAEAQNFCKLFFNANLSYEDMYKLIYPDDNAPVPQRSGSPNSGIIK